MILRAINILTLVASILLLASLSINILYTNELARYGNIYDTAMLIVCLIFIIDYLALAIHDSHTLRFMLRNIPMLVVSIPYHTIAHAIGITINHTLYIIIGIMVMLRGIMALYITLRWLIARRTTRLLWAYIATVVVCTYFAALFFYAYEAPVNSAIQGFGDALWWAGMNVTTVGATITPITTIGKVISVVLPIIGMAMFPVFTVYITSLYGGDGTDVAPHSNKPK